MNGLLDRIPRLTVDVGPRRLPVFRSLGIVGFHLGVASMVLVALLGELRLVTALGISAVAGMSFFAWGLLRRAITGVETLVLIEYVWVALALVAGYLWTSGGPVVAGLDAMAVALCWFLACGRLGCATVGCCHGVPAGIGLRYGPEHGLAPRLTDRRLLPVQLLEAAGLVLIGLIGLALVGGPDGRPTVWFLVAYAVLRFGCEALRGDVRPLLLGLSVPRLMCLVQAAAGVAAAEAWLVPGSSDREVVAGAAVLGLASVAGTGLAVARGRNPLTAAAHLDETWELVTMLSAAAPSEPVTARTSIGMTVAVSCPDGGGLHVSLSHADHDTVGVATALAVGTTVVRGAVTHIAVPPPAGPSTVAPRPTRAPAQAQMSALPNGRATDYFERITG